MIQLAIGMMLLLASVLHGAPAQAAAPSLLTEPAMPNATRPGAAITPDGTRLYTTDFSAAKMYSTNLATNVTTTITLSGVITTSGIAMTPSGIAYVTDLDSDRLLVFNTATDTVDDSLAVGNGPRNVALSPDQTRAYVVNFFADTVSVVNTATKSVIATVPVGDGPFDVAVSSDGRYAYVSNTYASTLSVIDTTNNTVGRTISLTGYYPLESLVISPQDDTVFVLVNSSFAGGLVSVNAASGTASAVPLTAPRSLALTPDGSRLYVSTDGSLGSGRGLSVFDTTTNSLATTLATTFEIQGLALSPDAGLLYGPGQTKLQRVDTGLRTVIFDANGGSGSMTPQGGYSSTPLSANSLVRSGYNFSGWNTASGGGGTPYQDQGLYSFAADDTLYAQWTAAGQQPSAPSITGVTPSGTTASVAFTADDSGGSTITRLEFALDDTNTVDDSTTNIASPKTLSGLAMSTNYTVFMRAVNAQGAGPWSAPVSFRTQGRPGIPVVTGVTPDTSSASVAFTADDSGGSTILAIQYALDDTNTIDGSSTNSSPITLTGLTSGTSYALYVRAMNSWGPSPWSTATSFTTLTPPPLAPIPPSAPLNVRSTAGKASLSATWSAPISPGSYPVTQYQATASPGGRSCITASTTCAIDGLRNGTAYTVTVRALSGAGWSAESTPSNAVTPQSDETASITITGTRGTGAQRSRVSVTGMSEGLAGATVRFWVSEGGKRAVASTRTATIAADGSFTWSRKLHRAAVIYAEAGGVRSNAIRLSAAR